MALSRVVICNRSSSLYSYHSVHYTLPADASYPEVVCEIPCLYNYCKQVLFSQLNPYSVPPYEAGTHSIVLLLFY